MPRITAVEIRNPISMKERLKKFSENSIRIFIATDDKQEDYADLLLKNKENKGGFAFKEQGKQR